MQLVIAEKPSVARAIAEAVARNPVTRDGFIDAGGITITWCFGHLFEQAPPDFYSPALKQWKLDTLPFHIESDQWTLLARKDATAQIKTIGQLLQQADSVVNAGDNGREGQLLVDEVLTHFNWRGRTSRLTTNDLNAAPMRKAWSTMRDNALFVPLYQAGLCRQRADWLVGMNVTRAASIKTGLTASIGRVQTPTLAIVVKRDREIEAHASRVFYILHVEITAKNPQGRATTGVLSHDVENQRIFDKAEATQIAEALHGQTVSVTLDTSVKTEHAPLPYMLASFHKDAEKAYGWTAKYALQVLQALYEGKWISYPRVDCAYLPSAAAGDALAIADLAIARLGKQGVAFAGAKMAMKPSPRIYDDSKLGEHHGIVPTTRPFPATKPEGAKNWDDAERGWALVARRFVLGLLPPAVYDVREARFTFADRVFSAKGETIRPGITWRNFDPRETKTLDLDLPDGSTTPARAGGVKIEQRKTTPAKPYTEASLITDMRQAAKFVTDPALKAVLKKTTGIGTPATQGEIIEALKRRGYITVVGRGQTKYLSSSEFGRYLVDNIPSALTDAGITAAWEQALSAIAEGTASADEFMERIRRYVARQVDLIKQTVFPPPPKQEVQHTPKPKPAEAKSHKRRRTGAKA